MASDVALDGREDDLDMLSLDESVSVASSREIRRSGLRRLWEGMCFQAGTIAAESVGLSCRRRETTLQLIPTLILFRVLRVCGVDVLILQQLRTSRRRKRMHITRPRSVVRISLRQRPSRLSA